MVETVPPRVGGGGRGTPPDSLYRNSRSNKRSSNIRSTRSDRTTVRSTIEHRYDPIGPYNRSTGRNSTTERNGQTMPRPRPYKLRGPIPGNQRKRKRNGWPNSAEHETDTIRRRGARTYCADLIAFRTAVPNKRGTARGSNDERTSRTVRGGRVGRRARWDSRTRVDRPERRRGCPTAKRRPLDTGCHPVRERRSDRYGDRGNGDDMSGRVIEQDELDELERVGVAMDPLRTSRAFRMSEWDYVTEADLAGATADYSARLARVKGDISRGAIVGARARRALRIAEHAVTVAERQTNTTNYAADEGDGSCIDPLLDYATRAAADSFARPTSDQVIVASCNPMGATSWSLHLENMATRLLHAHGIRTAPRPDVWSKRHGTHLATADRVAFKGTARYALPQPCRYGALGNEPAELGNLETRATELLTTPSRHLVAGQWVANTGKVRTAFRGHRKVLVSLAETSQRKSATVRALKRAAAVAGSKVGKRGPAVGPWNLSPRSLPVAIKRDLAIAAMAERIEAVMRTSCFGASLTFSDGMVAMMSDVSLSTCVVRDVAMPVRELSRRAALAGLALD